MFPKQTMVIACSVFCIAAYIVKNANASKAFMPLTQNTVNRLFVPSVLIHQADTSHLKNISYTIINIGNNTYGYDIFIDKKRYIHQLTIPGVPGNKGFSSKTDAEKTAKLVIEKISKGQIPPGVTTDELKHLHIIQ